MNTILIVGLVLWMCYVEFRFHVTGKGFNEIAKYIERHIDNNTAGK